MYDYKYLLENSDQTLNDGDYTTNEINFGIANPNLGATGRFGMHIVVTTSFGGATEGVYFWVCHGANTAPTTLLVGRFFALADLASTNRKHWFIPIPRTVLQYVRGLCSKHNSDTNAGKAVIWLGPDEDGTE